jgi:hypothetical protein
MRVGDADLKSEGASRAGSSPTPGTTIPSRAGSRSRAPLLASETFGLPPRAQFVVGNAEPEPESRVGPTEILESR